VLGQGEHKNVSQFAAHVNILGAVLIITLRGIVSDLEGPLNVAMLLRDA
jgi:hypothetical protein